jgi:hypothetical protein
LQNGYHEIITLEKVQFVRQYKRAPQSFILPFGNFGRNFRQNERFLITLFKGVKL